MDSSELTVWLLRLREGDPDAHEAIWKACFPKLAELARRRLQQRARRDADEEDLALSALDSFFRGVDAGRFNDLASQSELWRMLVTITARKIRAQLRRQYTQKRGAGGVRGDSVLQIGGTNGEIGGWDRFAAAADSPDIALIAAEEFQRLLAKIEDDLAREIVTLRLEGYSNEEIAQQINRSTRTVERKLNLVRKLWSGEVEA